MHNGPQPKAIIVTTHVPGQPTVVQVHRPAHVLPLGAVQLPPPPVAVVLPTPSPVVLHAAPSAIRRIYPHTPTRPHVPGLHGPVGIQKPKHLKAKHTRVMVANAHPFPVLPAAALHGANQPPLRQAGAPAPFVPQPPAGVVRKVIRKK